MAAALAVVFAGSYISCVVQKELDTQAQEMAEDKKEAALGSIKDVSVTSSSYNTSADLKQTSSSVVKTTSTPSQTTAISSVTETTSVVQTTPVTEPVTAAPPPPETPAPPAPQPNAMQGAVPESPAVGSEYLDECAFVGDSHIEGMGAYGIVSKDRVFAKSGLSLAHIDQIDVESIKSSNPKHIYIMMGTNGVAWMKFSDMIDSYTNFINTLKQSITNADIYIISIPPVSSERESRKDAASGKMLNSDIDAYNAELLKMASENGCYYLDVNSSLKDASGCLSGSTDGVHMPVGTYNTFKDYILTHIAG